MPLLAFIGEHSIARRAAVTARVDSFVAAEGDMNLSRLENPRAADVMTACETAPFLGTSRLVVVTDFNPKEASDTFIAQLQDVPEHCTLIFSSAALDARTKFAKVLQKHGEVQHFDPPKPAAFGSWVQGTARDMGVDIAPAAAQLLADYTHGNADTASSELAKLAAATDGQITVEDVRALTPPDLAASVFELSDAIGQRRTQQALHILGSMVDRGENLMQIFFMVVRHLRILLSVHAARATGVGDTELASVLKLHPFVAKKAAQQAHNLPAASLQAALAELLTVDQRIKTGRLHISTTDQSELALAIEKLLVSMK